PPSQKFRNFQSTLIGEKAVTTVAGIGNALGGRLVEKGYDKAYMLLGQFLVLKKDPELFQNWLHKTCKADSKRQKECADCLAEYVRLHL
ncbi:hypothetical protein RvY_14562-2, partial [Ramazzottius varieornatus]